MNKLIGLKLCQGHYAANSVVLLLTRRPYKAGQQEQTSGIHKDPIWVLVP